MVNALYRLNHAVVVFIGKQLHFPVIAVQTFILYGSRVLVGDRVTPAIGIVKQKRLFGIPLRHTPVELPLVVGQQKVGADILRKRRHHIVKAHAVVKRGGLQESVVFICGAAYSRQRFIVQPI